MSDRDKEGGLRGREREGSEEGRGGRRSAGGERGVTRVDAVARYP